MLVLTARGEDSTNAAANRKYALFTEPMLLCLKKIYKFDNKIVEACPTSNEGVHA